MISDNQYAPNIGKEAHDFFQSDRDLELQEKRQLKQESIGKTAGDPKSIASKVLGFEFGGVLNEETVYVAESGHVARKLNIKVGL